MNYTARNTGIDIYFKEIRNFSGMSMDDEERLFTRIKAGDTAAETEVFNKNAKLAVAIAKTYTGDADLLSDLIQEANMGILKAISKFDYTKGFRFGSYARFWMKAYISDFLNELGIVHPNNPSLIQKVRKVARDFYAKNNREATEYELMEILEDMGEMVTDTSILSGIKVDSLDKTFGDDADFTLADSAEISNRTASINDFEDDIRKESLKSEILGMMNCLDERERRMIKMYYGIGYDYEMDYNAIAEKETKRLQETKPGKSITAERVRQIVIAAEKKMRENV